MNLTTGDPYDLAAFVIANKPLRFELWRGNDEGGLSGTGKVVEGMVFSDGTGGDSLDYDAVERDVLPRLAHVLSDTHRRPSDERHGDPLSRAGCCVEAE